MNPRRALLVFVLSAGTALAQSSNPSQPNASPSSDQGTSAYGNDTYRQGTQAQAPASMNSSPTAADAAIGPGKSRTGNASTEPLTGTPNASHTSDTRAERQSSDSSTKPSTANPANGNSPASAPPGSSGSNTGGPPRAETTVPSGNGSPQFLIASLAEGVPQKAEPNKEIPATPQANSGNPSSAASLSGLPGTGDSAALQSRIQEALREEPALSGSRITVNVTDSAIELAGTVNSGKDRQTADRIAQSFDGNRKFEDKLVVTGTGAPGQHGSSPSPQR